MKRYAFVPLVAVAFAACADLPTAGDDLNLKAAAPNTSVSGNFTITSDPVITYRTTPVGGSGTCGANGVWTNAGGKVHDEGHTQCTDVTPGSEVVVTFSAVANYVQANSGNIQLNFTSCGYVEDEDGNWIADCDSKAYVHYKKNGDERAGSGALLATGDDDSQWIISLGQIGGPGAGGLAPGVRAFSGLLAEKVGSADTYGAASFSW
jgi:hypothetical protein